MRAVSGVALMASMLMLARIVPAETTLEAELRQACRAFEAMPCIEGTKELVMGEESWVLLKSELRYAGTPRFWGAGAAAANPRVKPELADPVPAIVDFNNQLHELGIELVFMPAPIRELVYPESILGVEKIPLDRKPPHLHPVQNRFFETLREQGVTVMDVLPIFLEHRHRGEHGRLYCPSETHWTSYAMSLAARELAGMISRRSWYAGVEKQRFSATWQHHKHTGSIYQKLGELFPELPEYDEVQIRQVRYESGDKIAQRHPDSPVVIIGDSYTTWWRQHSAAFPHQLAYELSFPVDLLSTAGGGATETRLNFIRTIRSNPGYLDNKKIVIWCFSARTLVTTREGWVKLPLDPGPKNQSPAQARPAGGDEKRGSE